MPGSRQYAWVTTVVDENTAFQAAVLAKSLIRVITASDTIVLISENVPQQLRELLSKYFDFVIRVNLDDMRFADNWAPTDILKVFATTMEMYAKIVILDPNCLVLKNCDELFQLEKDYYIPDTTRLWSPLLPIFVMKPYSELKEDIIKLGRSSQLCCAMNEIFTDSCDLLSKKTVGDLSMIYGAKLNDLQNSNQNTLLKLKLISFAQSMEVATKEDSPIQKLVDFWTSCVADIEDQYRQDTIIEGPKIKQGRTYKNGNYFKDAIAIVGHSCRFPEANNVDEFWELLINGGDGIDMMPRERLELLQLDGKRCQRFKAGFLKCPIDEFDARFFGISPREAELMDPQQRLLLEVAWEALENAAINPHSLKGGNTGVFTGVWQADYEKILKANTPTKAFHNIVLGNSFSANSSRLSYFLGLNGPNIAMESGCSSSMVALHLACESLKRHEVDLGLVAGTNVVMWADESLEIPILAKDGHCKTFDDKADGFGRAEGVAVFVIKRFSDAVANGDRVMGIIRGSAMSSEGLSSSFGTPSKVCQEIAVKDALKNSAVNPEDVDYVEAHGTGTPVGDPIEFAALSAGYTTTKRKKPLIVGSVKTNIGHTEATAGLAGILKVILSMRHEIIPPHKNFDTLNPNINLESIPAILPLEKQVWAKNSDRIRIAGVSSFGISGTNVHVLIEEPPNENGNNYPVTINSLEADRSHCILNLSAKTENALDELGDRYCKYLEKNPQIDIKDFTFTANNGRAHFNNHRISITGKDVPQLTEMLKEKRFDGPVLKEQPKIAFLFTGQGSQYKGMAHDLYKSNSIFRDSFDKSSDIIKQKTGIILKDFLWSQEKGLNILSENSVACQLSIFCIECALMTLLFSLGVKPDFVLGHSVGEYAAAVASAIIGLEDALVLLIKRSQLIAQLPNGGMLAIGCSKEKALDMISKYTTNNNQWIDIAVINSPKQTVVAGNKDSLEKFHEFCKANSIRVTALAASHSFHSRDIDGILNEFEQITSKIEYKNPVCQYISGTTGSLLAEDEMKDGRYWLRHAREPVNFHEGIQTLAQTGCNVFVEIGPRPILLALGMSSLTSLENTLWLPTLQKNKDNWEVLLGSLGKLYVNGIAVDWSAIDTPEKRKKLEIPTYPFQRQKYWINIPDKSESKKIHPLLGRKVSFATVKDTVYSNHLKLADFSYIRDHQVANLVIMPGAGFLEIILAVGKDLLQVGNNSKSFLRATDFIIESAFEVEEGKSYETQVVATHPEENEDSLAVSVYIFNKISGWKQHAKAFLSLTPDSSKEFSSNIQNIQNLKSRVEEKSSSDFYKEIQKSGIHFGEKFQSIKSIWSSENESLVSMSTKSLPGNAEEYLCHPIVLDAMLQATALTMETQESSLYLPIGIESCLFFGALPSELIFAHVQWNTKEGKGTVSLYNSENDMIFKMTGVRFIRTKIGSFLNAIGGQKNTLPGLYEEVWRPRLGPFESRVDLESLPDFPDVIAPLEKAMENDMKSFRPLVNNLIDEYILLKLIKMFSDNNIFLELGAEYTTSSIMVDNFVSLDHIKLFDRIIDMLVENGNIIRLDNSDDWKVIKQFPTPNQILSEIVKLHKQIQIAFPIELNILDKCFDTFWSVVTGKLKPVDALFGRNDMNVLEVYTKGVNVNLANVRMANFLRCILSHLKVVKSSKEHQIVRIIEIGGGSAASSKQILKMLQQNEISFHYTFTDVSAQFFENAKKELSSFDMVDYKVLDIEKDPYVQGFCPLHYDFVVASNVIHATSNIKASVRNISKLLVDGGILILQEILQPWRSDDIIFGILDGYWSFTDYDLRKSHPLIPKESWDQVFSECHFGVSHLLSTEDERTSVLVAKVLHKVLGGESSKEAEKTWLVFCDDNSSLHETLAERLSTVCRDIMFLKHSQQSHSNENFSTFNMLDESQFEMNLFKITESKDVCGVIYLMTSITSDENDNFKKTLNFCKYFSKNVSKDTKVIAVTRGAVCPTNQETVTPFGAITWGMFKSLGNEVPKLFVCLVDLDPDVEDTVGATKEIFYECFNRNEKFICYRRGKKFVSRFIKFNEQMAPLSLPNGGYKIQLPSSKRIADLNFISLRRSPLASHDVEVIVKAMSLNFRDILVILKPDGYHTLFDEVGSDFAGVVSNVGPSVTKFKVGDAVFGFGRGTAASHIVQKETDVLFHIPSHFNIFEAATIASCYLTAHYCLVTVANLKKNETVLIHVASGGVGLYAIQVAKYIGARILVTAGSHRKRSYLKSLGLKHVFHSRNLTFGSEIKKLTNGNGVDVVLNSLTSEGFKETTLENCAKYARFVEIGKVNIWQLKDVQELRPDIVYTIVDLEKVEPKILDENIKAIYDTNLIKPVAYSRFDIKNIRHALNYFLKAQHIGKIVISMPELCDIGSQLNTKELLFNKTATYLITGGLGGIGLVVAKWMVDYGAECLVLVGRSPPKSEVLRELSKLRMKGCRVLTFEVDVGSKMQCDHLFQSIFSGNLQLPPLKGIIHSAGVLADAVLANQTWEKYQVVFNAKVQGCLNLHNFTKGMSLDHFVLFSSVAATFAPLGQSNHCAANTFLDSFALYRRSIGLPAQTINWGAWSEVGVASKSEVIGMYPFNPNQGIAALQFVMSRPDLTQLAVVQLNAKEFGYVYSRLGAYVEETLDDSERSLKNVDVSSAGNQSDKFWEEIKELTLIDRALYIKHLLVNFIKEILKVPKGEQLSEQQMFPDMGLDSLMSVEFKNKIQILMGDGLLFSATTLAKYPTIASLSEHLAAATLDKVVMEDNRLIAVDEDVLKNLIKQDSILPADIRGCGNFVKASGVKNILLTGVTGHLGCHLLEQILKIRSLNVVCLVRASNGDQARNKLLSTLKRYKLSVDFNRINLITGDVAHDQFGISNEKYNELSGNIDAVFHLAAKVTFVESYLAQSSNGTDIRSVNVLGTINVLRFSGNIKTKRVFYSSSVVAINKLNSDVFANEEFPDHENNGDGMALGYALTKFVSEKLIGQAITRGIPCIVIRYPNVAGNSLTQHFHVGSDFAMNVLLLSIKVGVIFNKDGWSLLASDIASEITMDLISNDDIDSGMYNLFQPNPINSNDLKNIIADIGYRMEIVSLDKFIDAIQTEGASSVFSVFKSTYGPDFLRTFFGSSDFLNMYALNGSLTSSKLSPKIIKAVPNVLERIGCSLNEFKNFLSYAKLSGIL